MPQAELVVVSGKQAGTIIPLPDGKFLIGREEDCHLRPNSDLVSRHHCVFTVDDFTVRLRDLGSTNGTLVNGDRIRGGVVLTSGDVVAIGKMEFRIVIREAAHDTVSNLVVESPTQTSKIDDPSPIDPGAPLEALGSSAEIPIVKQAPETAYELNATTPAMPPVNAAFQTPPMGDTQFAGQMPQQMMYPHAMGYPQMMPYGYPGYPQMYGQPMGYGMPPGYPQGYMAPPVAVPEAAPVAVESPSSSSVASMPVKLPDPSETGLKAPPPKPAAPAGGDTKTAEAKAKEEAPRMAEDIIQQYLKRRPTSGDKK